MAATTFTPFPRLPAELRCAIWQEAVPARTLRVIIRAYGSPASVAAWFEFVEGASDLRRHTAPVWDLMTVCWEAYVEVRCRALPDRALFAVPKPKCPKGKIALVWLPISREADLFCVRDVLAVAENLYNALPQERGGDDDDNITIAPPLREIAVEPALVVADGIGGGGGHGVAVGDQVMYTAAFLGVERVSVLRWQGDFETRSAPPQSLLPLGAQYILPSLEKYHPNWIRPFYYHMLRVAEQMLEEERREALVMAMW
jgi:hypothetical protein